MSMGFGATAQDVEVCSELRKVYKIPNSQPGVNCKP